jgi:hypothetical protein
MYGRGFKTPLCKFCELVMAYEPKSSNDTGEPQAFYVLYMYPNKNGSGHVVFSLKMKTTRSTQKCVPQPMTQDIINLVNKMGKEEKVKDGIQFFRIDGGAMITDLYPANENDYDSCASDKDYKFEDEDVNDSDNNLSDNEEWVEDDNLPESKDNLKQSEDEYDLNDGMAPDEQSDHFNQDSLNADVDEGNNEDASKLEFEESDHQSLDDNSQNEDQEDLGPNIVESDIEEDDDDFDDENDVDTQQ